MRHLSFVICHLSFVIRHLSFVIRHLSFVIRRLSFFIRLALLIGVLLVGCFLVAAHRERVRGLPDDFPAPVAESDVPSLGVNVALEQYTGDELDATLTHIAEGGFVWVRQSFQWSEIETNCKVCRADMPHRPNWAIPDRIVEAISRHPQLRLIAVLEDTPSEPPTKSFSEHFAAFAREFATRYGDRIDYYQIWDEPNLTAHWGGGPVNPRAYADLLARAACAIRAADPEARILLAGLAPTTELGPQNLSDVRYLEQLYQAGAAPYFDIVTGKPYGFGSGPDDRRVDESVLNFSRLILLREVMVRQGDAKAIWASHWGWNALPPDWSGEPSIWGQTDEETQAAYSVAALERARREWPWAGAMIIDHYQPDVPLDNPRWGFTLVGPDGEPRPVYAALSDWAASVEQAAPTGGYPARNRWASYGEGWRVGELGADAPAGGEQSRTTANDLIGAMAGTDSAASFRFDGPALALTVRRGPYRGFLYVNVDDEPANALPRDEDGRAYVVLYDKTPTVATVPLATELAPGPHTVEVIAEGGHNQWALVDWRVGLARSERFGDGYAWKMGALILAGLALIALLIRDARRLDWAAASSWIRRHLAIGLALVAFTAPFYLQAGAMLHRALSLPEILTLLCGLAYCGLHIADCKEKPGFFKKPGFWVLLLAAVTASVAAADHRAALFELRSVFLMPMLYYALLRGTRLNDKHKWRVVDGFVLGGVGVALVGLVQYALGRNLVIAEGGLPRLQSVYYSPNNVGLYLGRVWPLLMAIAIWGRGAGWRRKLYALALAPVTLALVLSFSRGALLLGIPAALLAMGWWAGKRWRWAALAIVAIGVLALVPLLRVPRFASLLDPYDGSTFFRLKVWRSSLTMIREHPIFGVGPGNFAAAYRTRYVLPSAWEEFNLEHPHNLYLDHWTRLGLLGVLAGALIQFTFWRRAWRARVCRGRPCACPHRGHGHVGAGLVPAPIEGQAQGLPLRLVVGMKKKGGHKARPYNAVMIGFVGGMAALLAHGLVDNTLFFTDLSYAFFLMLALST